MNLEKLAAVDPEINAAICEELGRQRNKIELIASENFVSPAVMEAMGTVLTNKYAESLIISNNRFTYTSNCWHIHFVSPPFSSSYFYYFSHTSMMVCA